MMPPFERTKCACDTCRVGCKTMPGALIPGDLERIAEHTGHADDDAWILEHFRLSDGAIVAKRVNGKLVQWNVPSIVPASKPDGSCVFLDENERCTIHEVSPFGCAYHDTHMEFEEANKRTEYCVRSQMDGLRHGSFRYWCLRLAEAGKQLATSLFDRKEAYRQGMIRAEAKKQFTTHG